MADEGEPTALPRFTEENATLREMYNEARGSQYAMHVLQEMPDDQLVYLAGHQIPHPDIGRDQEAKLRGNAHRARAELDRRAALAASKRGARATYLAAAIGVVGVLIGVALGASLANDDPPLPAVFVEAPTTSPPTTAPTTTTTVGP
jgi:hypothetical protein